MNVKWTLTDQTGAVTQDANTLWIAFDTNLSISKKTKTYSSNTEAMQSPIASKLFGFPWVEEITVSPGGLLVKRQDWVDFDIIADPLKELIEEHFKSKDEGDLEENPDPVVVKVEAVDLSDYSKEEALIVEFLTEEVNPQVASHGGKISFVKLEDGTVHLLMEGGCQGCGMAKVTLIDGVQTSLMGKFDFVKKVVDTTDHASGIKPYL